MESGGKVPMEDTSLPRRTQAERLTRNPPAWWSTTCPVPGRPKSLTSSLVAYPLWSMHVCTSTSLSKDTEWVGVSLSSWAHAHVQRNQSDVWSFAFYSQGCCCPKEWIVLWPRLLLFLYAPPSLSHVHTSYIFIVEGKDDKATTVRTAAGYL